MIKHTSQSGFTIVELLITSFVFSILAIGVTIIFIQILQVQSRAVAGQKIQENGLFIMELMSREIRVSQIQDQDSACALTSLTIVHPVNGTITYSLNNGILQRTEAGTTTDLSSSAVLFSRLNFCVMGSGPSDDEQARVTILASVRNQTGRETLTFNLQTTVASRYVLSEF